MRYFIKSLMLIALFALLSACAGQMLPGRMYHTGNGRLLEFSIQTSRGNGKMTARDPQTGELFSGEYSGRFTGQNVFLGNNGVSQVALFSPPTGANANGILVGNKGTVIQLFFEIRPGLRPTGHGIGRDQNGNSYEVFF